MITVHYSHVLPYKGQPLRPYVDIRLEGPRDSLRTLGLIDSGADTTIFHSSLIPVLGLNQATAVSSGMIRGVGGLTRSWSFWLDLHVVELRFRSLVSFSPGVSKSYGLLGRRDFFQAFQVGFDEAARRVLLEPRPPAA